MRNSFLVHGIEVNIMRADGGEMKDYAPRSRTMHVREENAGGHEMRLGGWNRPTGSCLARNKRPYGWAEWLLEAHQSPTESDYCLARIKRHGRFLVDASAFHFPLQPIYVFGRKALFFCLVILSKCSCFSSRSATSIHFALDWPFPNIYELFNNDNFQSALFAYIPNYELW